MAAIYNDIQDYMRKYNIAHRYLRAMGMYSPSVI